MSAALAMQRIVVWRAAGEPFSILPMACVCVRRVASQCYAEVLRWGPRLKSGLCCACRTSIGPIFGQLAA
jgi:hypothetical protein